MPRENLHSAAWLAIDLEPCGIECWGVGGTFFAAREGVQLIQLFLELEKVGCSASERMISIVDSSAM